MAYYAEIVYEDESWLDKAIEAGAEVLPAMEPDPYGRAQIKVDDLVDFLEKMGAFHDYDDDGSAAFGIPNTPTTIWVGYQKDIARVEVRSWECDFCGEVFTEEPVYGATGDLEEVREYGSHAPDCPMCLCPE